MKAYFDHEKLNVYQMSLVFNQWAGELLGSIEAKAAAKDHLDRAATSIPLNIAEGNGKFSRRDRARFSTRHVDPRSKADFEFGAEEEQEQEQEKE